MSRFLLPTQILCPLFQVNAKGAKSNCSVHENNADYLKVSHKCMQRALSLQKDGGKREKSGASYYTYMAYRKKNYGHVDGEFTRSEGSIHKDLLYTEKSSENQ